MHQQRFNNAKHRLSAEENQKWSWLRSGKGAAALGVSIIAIVLTLFGLYALFPKQTQELIWVNQEQIPNTYDVIVLGGEAEGIAAAVAAARNGAKTLLLVETDQLGGLMTLGKLNFLDMCHGYDGTLLTRGFFKEFYDALGGTAFDLVEAQRYFVEVLGHEQNLTLRTESQLIAPVVEDGWVSGLRMLEQGQEVWYTASRFIDGTVDGDLAALSGAPFTIGGEDIGSRDRQMAVTLVFELSGVSWTKIFLHLNGQRIFGMLSGSPAGVGATWKSAWGYEEEGFAYVPMDSTTRLRGFNIAKQRSGTVLINALLIFGVDPLEEESKLDAINRGKAELEHLIPYLQQSFYGFSHAQLAGVASQLYVRESRHILGEYQLSIDDVLENRDQWDKIAIGGYPADVQPSIEQPFGTVIGNPDRYALPFRCLVPQMLENLLIVGRSASYTSLAASSARVMPLGMVCGQAAGTAAAQSLRDKQSFREMSKDTGAIHRLQETLRKDGAYLDDFSLDPPILSHRAYEELASLRRLGLMEGGYQNQYYLDEPMDKWRFQYILNGVIRQAGFDIPYVEIDDMPSCSSVATAVRSVIPINKNTMPMLSGESYQDDLDILRKTGILSGEIEAYFSDPAQIPMAAELVMVLANLYDYLRGEV